MVEEIWTSRAFRVTGLGIFLGLVLYFGGDAIPGLGHILNPKEAIHPNQLPLGSFVEKAQPVDGTRVLRVVMPDMSGQSKISEQERTLLSEFALSEGLELEWIKQTDLGGLLSLIDSGEADIIASVNESISNSVHSEILITLPWAISKQQVVGRAGNNVKYALSDLRVRQLALKRSSPSWPLLSGMAKQYLSMELLEIPEHIETRDVLKRVSSGQYDLAVVDTISLPVDIGFHYEVMPILDLTEESFMSWGVSTDRISLHNKLNRFLSRKHLETVMARSYREDLPQIKDRRLLRLITYQSPVNYFYESGRFHGFEYNLINRFAEQHNMRLDVVIAESHDEMIELLLQGKGDVIAASAPENNYLRQGGIKRTLPYNYASTVVVSRDDEEISDIRDLQGRTIHLPPESPYRHALQRISNRGIDFAVIDTAPEENAESVLFGVSQGYYDLTLLGSHELASELSRQINLKAQFNLADPQALVWIVRDESTQLLTALNEYITNEYRKGFYNVIYSRYIKKPDTRRANSRLIAHIDHLSPYDDIVNKYADRYSFDWRLIVAQMYQESRFNPQAVSKAGARGLMQLLPTTAKMVGVKNLEDPEHNISGALRYLSYLRSRIGNNVALEDRTWFMLASYNAGFRRVRQARALAESMNLDKDKWFNNVEIAMLKMATPYMKDGKVVRICRCGQTAAYVREIRTLYNNYLRLTQTIKAASRITTEYTQVDEI